MEYLHYQKRINDVIIKCPIEAGIEILVYSIFDEILSTAEDKYALVDINRIWKNQDSRLSTETGISDIAIMSPDFVFKNEDVGTVYGFKRYRANFWTNEKYISFHLYKWNSVEVLFQSSTRMGNKSMHPEIAIFNNRN